LGRVSKGVKCSVVGCDKEAIRSLSNQEVSSAGLKVGTARRVYLCKDHYKEYKSKTRMERKLKKWRYSG
jgi:ribosomal protein L13E